jgi:hypothetical protein
MQRLSTLLKFCFALPVYQAINLVAYAKEQRGWAERLGVCIAMLPIFVISTSCRLAVWAIVLWVVLQLR